MLYPILIAVNIWSIVFNHGTWMNGFALGFVIGIWLVVEFIEHQRRKDKFWDHE